MPYSSTHLIELTVACCNSKPHTSSSIVSNALNTLVSGEKPGFQALSKRLIVLLCAEVVRQVVSDHGAVDSECSAANSG